MSGLQVGGIVVSLVSLAFSTYCLISARRNARRAAASLARVRELTQR